MQRLLTALAGLVIGLWVVAWILAHFGLILICAAGFGVWSWYQARHRG
jgi:hypothetical protein